MGKNLSLIDETICAICTTLGPGSVSIIRISGPESFNIVRKLFIPTGKKNFNDLEDRKMYLGQFVSNDKLIDEAICVLFRSPNSLTGQDVVEIHTHGGTMVPQMVMSSLLSKGARISEPGEFSFRAYQNGKIDLLKAEGVASLIASQTEAAVLNSTINISGDVRNKFNNIRDLGINLLAEIEARVDFPEDEIPEVEQAKIDGFFYNVIKACDLILNRYSKGRLVINGLRVLILGEPNAGKSTLLNAILSEDKAIVSSKPGTTRDILEADILYNGRRMVFSDTAGIRLTDEEVEIEGIKRAKDKVDYSDVVIILTDFNANWKEMNKAFDFVPRGKRLFVGNKIDLSDDLKEIEKIIKLEEESLEIEKISLISAKENIGVEKLLEDIALFCKEDMEVDFEEGILTSDRQANLLKDALKSLNKGREGFCSGKPFEIISIDIREFLDLIGKITGEVTNEDVYDALFSKFCIGK